MSNQQIIDEILQTMISKTPKCPGCGKKHERKRVGKSLTFVVKEPCGNAKGSIPLKNYK